MLFHLLINRYGVGGAHDECAAFPSDINEYIRIRYRGISGLGFGRYLVNTYRPALEQMSIGASGYLTRQEYGIGEARSRMRYLRIPLFNTCLSAVIYFLKRSDLGNRRLRILAYMLGKNDALLDTLIGRQHIAHGIVGSSCKYRTSVNDAVQDGRRRIRHDIEALHR